MFIQTLVAKKCVWYFSLGKYFQIGSSKTQVAIYCWLRRNHACLSSEKYVAQSVASSCRLAQQGQTVCMCPCVKEESPTKKRQPSRLFVWEPYLAFCPSSSSGGSSLVTEQAAGRAAWRQLKQLVCQDREREGEEREIAIKGIFRAIGPSLASKQVMLSQGHM